MGLNGVYRKLTIPFSPEKSPVARFLILIHSTPRSLIIFRAKRSSISLCRGIVEVFLLAGLKYTE